MKKLFILIILIVVLSSFSLKENECDEQTMPYWKHGINSRIKGEVPTLKRAFKHIQQTETTIEPANGFITLRLYISKKGKLCNLETFQIDENYQNTEFNNGALIKKLEQTTIELTDWIRDKEFKTYNLIRLKIKNGKIEEIF